MSTWLVTTTVSLPPGSDPEELRRALEESAVPAVRQLDDLVRAVWTVSDDGLSGVGIYRFASEHAARSRAASYTIGADAPGGATITDVAVLRLLVEVGD